MNPTNDPNAVPPPNGNPAVAGPPPPATLQPAAAPPQAVPPAPIGPQPQAMPPVPPPTSQPPGGNVTGISWDSVQKQKKQIWLMIAGSFAVFIIGLLIGFAALVGLFLGAFATRKAGFIKYQPGIIAGAIATLLNASLYLLVVFVRLH